MISLMCYFVERGLDDEAREKFRHSIEQPQIPTPRHLKVVRDTEKSKSVAISPKQKWRAPPGWTPPGWDEEKSFAAAKSFMSFQANPK